MTFNLFYDALPLEIQDKIWREVHKSHLSECWKEGWKWDERKRTYFWIDSRLYRVSYKQKWVWGADTPSIFNSYVDPTIVRKVFHESLTKWSGDPNSVPQVSREKIDKLFQDECNIKVVWKPLNITRMTREEWPRGGTGGRWWKSKTIQQNWRPHDIVNLWNKMRWKRVLLECCEANDIKANIRWTKRRIVKALWSKE
jgi:hypothetical protein